MLTKITLNERELLRERLMLVYTREHLRTIALGNGIAVGRDKLDTANNIAAAAIRFETAFTIAKAMSKRGAQMELNLFA